MTAALALWRTTGTFLVPKTSRRAVQVQNKPEKGGNPAPKKNKGERKHESTQLAGSEPGLVKDFAWLVPPFGGRGGRGEQPDFGAKER